MRKEERIVWLLNALLGCINTDGGHILLLGIGCLIALKFYPAALAPIGGALFMKIK